MSSFRVMRTRNIGATTVSVFDAKMVRLKSIRIIHGHSLILRALHKLELPLELRHFATRARAPARTFHMDMHWHFSARNTGSSSSRSEEVHL